MEETDDDFCLFQLWRVHGVLRVDRTNRVWFCEGLQPHLKILPDIRFMNKAQFVHDINNKWKVHPYFSKIHLKC
jgi:hypothetical protein